MQLATLHVLPMSEPLNVRLSARAAARLDRLQRKLSASKTQVVEDALVHLLGSLERDQAIWLTVPGEAQEAPEEEEE